jgi:hypothetical protein
VTLNLDGFVFAWARWCRSERDRGGFCRPKSTDLLALPFSRYDAKQTNTAYSVCVTRNSSAINAAELGQLFNNSHFLLWPPALTLPLEKEQRKIRIHL